MKIISYNLYKGGSADYRAWARVIDTLDPDILLFQESSDPMLYADQLSEPIRSTLEAHTLWARAGNNKWGSAIYVRQGIVHKIDVSSELAGWVVGAEISGLPWMKDDNTLLQIYSIHVPSGRGSYLAEVQAILDYIAANGKSSDIIIGGDFNVTVGIRQPGETLVNQPGELKFFNRMQEEFQLMNCWQVSNPNQPLAQTLRWRFSADSLPYHCDGIFVPAKWSPNLQHCHVLADENWQGKSDHYPVSATFSEPVGVA